MAAVWDNGPAGQSDRFVLLAIADYANDEGQAWPSIAGLCRKTCMSERGIQTVIRRLESTGWLSIEVGGGRRNCNLYTIKTPHMDAETPQEMHPAGNAPPHMDAETPQMDAINPAHAAPEPSRTIIEPPEGKERATRAPDQTAEVRRVLVDAGATPAAVTSFLSHYRAKVRKPLSPVGAERLAGTLRTIIDSGGDADDALGLAEERGWQSIKADWYFREKANDTCGKAGFGAGNRRQNRPDPALDQIARLAGISQAPGYDRH